MRAQNFGGVCKVYGSNQTCRANARLIAAAPELLEALEDLCDFNTESTQDKWDRARDIIAKARGQ